MPRFPFRPCDVVVVSEQIHNDIEEQVLRCHKECNTVVLRTDQSNKRNI